MKPLACIDVHYRDTEAVAAGVVFSPWQAATPDRAIVEVLADVEPYVPGRFYRRELPCLLAVLAKCPETPRVVLVDGYVWLGDEETPGLGAHLHEALEKQVAVVGVAKTWFRGAGPVCEVFRGRSEKPLYVSAVGMPLDEAAGRVRTMHGAHRVPTLLRRADSLSRKGGKGRGSRAWEPPG